MSNTPPSSRSRTLFILLGILAVGALVSIPWQRQQWAKLEQERKKNALQEAQLKTVKEKQQASDAALSGLTSTDPDQQLAAAAAQLNQPARRKQLPAVLFDLESKTADSAPRTAALAGLYQQLGYFDRAYALSQKAIVLAPREEQPLVRAAYLEMLLGYRDQALQHLKTALEVAPESPEPHLAMALHEDHQGRLPSAEKELRAAIQLTPQSWSTLALLAQNLHRQGKSAEAHKTLDDADQIAPGEPTLKTQRARMLMDQSSTHPKEGKALREAALRLVKEVQPLAPNSPDLFFLEGRLLRDLGREKEARAPWEQAYQLKPSYPQLRSMLGTLLVRQGERERGQALLAEARKTDDEEEAFNSLVIKMDQKPSDPEPRRALARWCMNHNRVPRAILEWSRLLEIAPNDPEATRALAELKQQRGDPH